MDFFHIFLYTEPILTRKQVIFMEIERKYRITAPPDGYQAFPSRLIEQAYLATDPVIRIRKEDDSYYLTYKSKGLLAREEYNLPLTKEAYDHLLPKADGIVITKCRYLIPMEGTSYTIEMDVFEGSYSGLILAEVEFPTIEEAESFLPPAWFGEDVTLSGEFQNSRLSREQVVF